MSLKLIPYNIFMERHIQNAENIAYFLDGKFKFLKIRFGMNGVMGLIPVIGDLIVVFLSLYLVWIALEMRLPGHKIAVMIFNILLNFLIGLVPLVGDFADFFHHANLKNLKILKVYSQKKIALG